MESVRVGLVHLLMTGNDDAKYWACVALSVSVPPSHVPVIGPLLPTSHARVSIKSSMGTGNQCVCMTLVWPSFPGPTSRMRANALTGSVSTTRDPENRRPSSQYIAHKNAENIRRIGNTPRVFDGQSTLPQPLLPILRVAKKSTDVSVLAQADRGNISPTLLFRTLLESTLRIRQVKKQSTQNTEP
jgi:hypothetical protein